MKIKANRNGNMYTKTFNNNGNIDLNVSTDTIADVDVSDLEYLSPNAVHHESHHNPLHKNLFPDSVRNEMLTHYNKIVIGSFKKFFQSVNTNNLAEVLQALKELNIVLANRGSRTSIVLQYGVGTTTNYS